MDVLIDALEGAAPTAGPLLNELLKDAAREITDLRSALKTMEGLGERRSKRRRKPAAPADA